MPSRSKNASGLKIGIVGGSIAGCAAAIELMRAGHTVQVYERSTGDLVGRGAGIGAPMSTLELLMDRDLIDLDMPYIHVTRMPHVGRVNAEDRYGRTAWVAPMQIEMFNWSDLWRSLRKRVPDECYHQGRTVTSAVNLDRETVTVLLEGNQVEEFDLVIFADGYRSLGRRLIFPGAEVRYRGYVLWRGVLNESELDDCEPLEGSLCRIGYSTGHAVFNLVPNADGSVHLGQRWVNWAMYVQLAEVDLPQFLVDSEGRRRPGSLPPGAMRPQEESRLKQLASETLPRYYSDIILASENTFAQPIYTVEMPAYFRDRICLAGDAGSFAQPFTTGGVFKSINNAVDLANSLANHSTVHKALAQWNRDEVLNGYYMTTLGRQLEDALIWNPPDFAKMNEPEMRDWWERAAKLPEDLFPPSDEPPASDS